MLLGVGSALWSLSETEYGERYNKHKPKYKNKNKTNKNTNATNLQSVRMERVVSSETEYGERYEEKELLGEGGFGKVTSPEEKFNTLSIFGNYCVCVCVCVCVCM